MLTTASMITSLALCAYLAWECARSPRAYRRLRLAIASDLDARPRFYRQIVLFELLSAALALTAMGGDALRPDRLELGDHPFVQTFATTPGDPAAMAGFAVAFAAGLVGGALLWARTRRRRPEPGPRSPLARALLPDYAPLLPETRRDRLWFVAVSLSAGVCEEIVFRGWLLAFLHAACGLRGLALVATAALAFGLAHLYQGGLPVLTTTCLGAVLCILYAATGSLVLPIVLHTLIDLRWAFLGAQRRPCRRRSR